MSAKISILSILIPVFNAEKTIKKCINSIFHNGFSDYEIILINDGSSDNSWKILETYTKKYPDKIRIFDQENQGVARTRNAGINYADAKYIMFVDCDDWIDSDYLQKFVEEIESRNLDIVIGGYHRTTNDKVLYEMRLKNTSWSRYMIMAPWSRIYRRDFLLENKIDFLNNSIGEDMYFNLQAINLTDKISIIDYCGYNWFCNAKSISNTKQKTLQNPPDVMYLLNSCFDKLKEIGALNKPEVEFYFTRYIIWYLLFSGKNSKYSQLCAEFSKAFKWLNEKFPLFYKNKNISLINPKGETMKNKFAVFLFISAYRLRIIKILLYLWSNKKL